MGEGNVCKFKFTLITALLETDIEDVYTTTKGTDANFRSIVLPGHGGDRVVVLDLFAADLVPGWALSVEVECVEAVEVTDNACLTSGVKASAGEFFDAFIF